MKLRVLYLFGLVLAAIATLIAPAKAASQSYGARFAIDVPSLFGMTTADALLFLVSAGVLGMLVRAALLAIAPDMNESNVQFIITVICAVASAGVTAGLKFIPPEFANLQAWQAVLAVLGFIASNIGASTVRTLRA